MSEPEYFDSQAQAAAVLKVEIEDLRQAKRDGCPAFRSGRVYRAALESWLAQRRQPEAARIGQLADDDMNEVPNLGFVHWEHRRSALLELLTEFLRMNHKYGNLSDEEFLRIGFKAIEPVLHLGRIFNAEIDENMFRASWFLQLLPLAKKQAEQKKKARRGAAGK